ncbi:MAG: hypothetical protein KJ606_11175 [Chloroflexi bacterium]|nr:hypothetical protein [Chloroflexota bacterium]
MKQLRTVILPRILALVLWLISLVLGLFDIYFAREIFYAIYARFSTQAGPAILIGNAIIFIMAIVYLGLVVMTSEYHVRNVGKPESWNLFTKTIVAELAIPFLAYFM